MLALRSAKVAYRTAILTTKKKSTYPMKTALRKILAAIAAFIVLGLIALLVGSLEEQYQIMFPNYSDVALRNIESVSNIVGLVLAVVLSIKTYKLLAAKKDK